MVDDEYTVQKQCFLMIFSNIIGFLMFRINDTFQLLKFAFSS
ncbi:hypothetical protein BTN50_0572 [Candidatus Enterovibrio altilux]|uniref:Uncharacterized protein n=1 Tax=Candidatus Enterovibrio altilux TaxID=1927128 RepID=A0A291B7U8_9GAMM|nr:hypothetical protein BTN50_0572 [Candidatus Enterovibrio luxaltus]